MDDGLNELAGTTAFDGPFTPFVSEPIDLVKGLVVGIDSKPETWLNLSGAIPEPFLWRPKEADLRFGSKLEKFQNLFVESLLKTPKVLGFPFAWYLGVVANGELYEEFSKNGGGGNGSSDCSGCLAGKIGVN